MKKIAVGDKVILNHGINYGISPSIDRRMKALQGNVFTINKIRVYRGVSFYGVSACDIPVYWLRKWFTPISELTLDDLLKLNITS